ncbi:MAG: type I-MYXAN CRISPR-associated Cas8a1/Cmx1 [Planctomycetia bacterium]|nr:type I-MYXAN CRISPR-associated Cas8a1/Cmx1 [Planctomycetia bacterium]
MEKTIKKEKTKAIAAPSSLHLKLSSPGMSAMHRAGLGGLAATLTAYDRLRGARQRGFKDPRWHKEFSWKITPTEITLDFGKPELAEAFFEWLFTFAFQIRDDMIYLPGQYDEAQGRIPTLETRARLQQGITLTFLQHGQTRKLGDERNGSYEVGEKKIDFSYKKCSSYMHQSAWKEWCKNGKLVLKDYDVQGPVNPGAVVRHNAFAGPTKVSQPLELVLPLQFALIGTISLPVNRAVGVLVIPYIDDLVEFAESRSSLTPTNVIGTYVASAGDAVLQFEVKRRGLKISTMAESSGCDVLLFRPMPWSTQQKSRSDILSVCGLDEATVRFYDLILALLPPRIGQKVTEKKNGRGKNAETVKIVDNFWADSVVRPFVADNLVRGNFWFAGFARFMNSTDPGSGKPLREKINFEREGLNKMVTNENVDWKLEGANSFVLAVQDALRCQYGQVSEDKNVTDAGRKKRLEGEYDKWRLLFSNAKTIEQFRFALSDFFSRAKQVPTLKDHWKDIIRLTQDDWQLARDLALLGLASYKKKEKESPTESQDGEKQDN